MKRLFWKFYVRIRFGKITSKITDITAGVVFEEEYYGRNGKVVGHTFCGRFNPAYPYKGQDF